MTCVPLSFYISSQFGSEEYKTFWKQIDGSSDEEKFGSFLKQLEESDNDFGFGGEVYKNNPLFTSTDEIFFGSASSKHSIAENGMMMQSLFESITEKDPLLSERLNLNFVDFDDDYSIQPNVQDLHQKLLFSVKNGVPPILGWRKLQYQAHPVVGVHTWIESYSHAITIINVSEQSNSVTDNYFYADYIDNQDGLQKKAIIYSTLASNCNNSSACKTKLIKKDSENRKIYFRNVDENSDSELFEVRDFIASYPQE